MPAFINLDGGFSGFSIIDNRKLSLIERTPNSLGLFTSFPTIALSKLANFVIMKDYKKRLRKRE